MRYIVKRWLREKAHPVFDCQNCISMPEHGCYCSYHDCVAPCMPAGRWVRLLRRVLQWIE